MSRGKKYALISVSDKTNIEKIAKFLVEKGYEILSTGGTSRYLKEKGVDVVEIHEITDFPEVFSGRVKTLHPKIFGGILYRRDTDDEKELGRLEIPSIDIVIVNLYPFEKALREGYSEEQMIENIDIGGPSLIRASAKNYKHVTILTDPSDYDYFILEYEKNGEIPLNVRKEFSRKAFLLTSYYDSLIAGYLGEENENDKYFVLGGKKLFDLRYGENPHQRGALFSEYPNSWLENFEKLGGKELSYNNIKDIYEALRLRSEFEGNFCAIIKHTNPCGAGVGESIKESYLKALSGDPKSAFGGIVVFSGKVDEETALEMKKMFFEVVIADDYDDSALEILKKKKNLRIIKLKGFEVSGREVSFISGGFLLQEADKIIFGNEYRVVSGEEPEKDVLEDILFSTKIVKHLKSNAISISKNKTLYGYGTGFTSRVDAVKFAIEKAKEFGRDLKGAILSSDAFFPFPDSIEIAASSGIKYIVQPGGSIRDNDVIEKARELGITMIFTGIRHFKH